MKCVKQEAPGVLHWGCLHWHPDYFKDISDFEQLIKKDLADSGITHSEFESSKLILNFLEEGHNASALAPVAKYFETSHPGRYLILNSMDFAGCMANHGNFLTNLAGRHTDKVNSKFLCLIRRASASRAKFASQLRQQVPKTSLTMTFGSLSYLEQLREYQPMFDDVLPITLDGVIDQHQIHKIYNVENSWFESGFNVICETSSQSDPGIWTDLFITEKTFKCFAMHQIPIWFAVPGLVNKVRTLGLDLFDDIVDHSYDQIQDEDQRRQAVIDQIARLDQQFDLTQCQNLRKRLWPRLCDNYLRLQSIVQQHRAQLKLAITQFINQGSNV
jgi:hypothetical protein